MTDDKLAQIRDRKGKADFLIGTTTFPPVWLERYAEDVALLLSEIDRLNSLLTPKSEGVKP